MRCGKCSTPTMDVIHTYEQTHRLQARIAELEEVLRIARPLLQETVDFHRDPASEEYNECEESRCSWCEEAQMVLDAD